MSPSNTKPPKITGRVKLTTPNPLSKPSARKSSIFRDLETTFTLSKTRNSMSAIPNLVLSRPASTLAVQRTPSVTWQVPTTRRSKVPRTPSPWRCVRPAFAVVSTALVMTFTSRPRKLPTQRSATRTLRQNFRPYTHTASTINNLARPTSGAMH